MFHAVDILPTLLQFVSDISVPVGLDGVSHWGTMTQARDARLNTRHVSLKL